MERGKYELRSRHPELSSDSPTGSNKSESENEVLHPAQ